MSQPKVVSAYRSRCLRVINKSRYNKYFVSIKFLLEDDDSDLYDVSVLDTRGRLVERWTISEHDMELYPRFVLHP